MIFSSGGSLRDRLEACIGDWKIVVEHTLETETSLIAFGRRDDQPVVLKVLRQGGDEWRSGEVLKAFDGNGTVHVYESRDGAVLLDRLNPGTSLSHLALTDRDEEATEIVAEVIKRMSFSTRLAKTFPTVHDWGKGFQRYLDCGDTQISAELVREAQATYSQLCESQKAERLLHGDLQHYNVLFDRHRGWTAIDPKGVVGEVEFEIGAALRNPNEKPELFTSPEMIERRIRAYEAKLKLNANRLLAWGFSQAVLSAIWSVEDGYAVDSNDPSLMRVNVMRSMLN